ncbi:hypothetical protein COCON_G00071000 [Conger conger]|uniref:Uncharacterized protein n=1 Tax=Conger conger TaxID=82655 RepID=A0A9Q1DTS7_CONCO|nr:hypothetical protein COCON_G00071000 [Conger conger]
MKTEPVMDSTDYTGLELRSCLIKSEDAEESIEGKNGCGMSREEELILSNIKEEEEEGGERRREEVKTKDGVKDEELAGYEWKEEERNGDEMIQNRVLKQDERPDCKEQDDEGFSPNVTSCLFTQPRVPSPRSPVISSSKGRSGVFGCSQCPFTHLEEVKLHQHVEKVKTEPVMDSTDYTGLELRSCLIKSEDAEESIERKNGCGMSREEELILSNIKEEEEEGGERQREEVKTEDGVKDEEVAGYEWKEEKVLKQDGLPDCKEQEDEGLSVTSCQVQQPRLPSPSSPVISSSKGNAGQSEVFGCSQCPFAHLEEVKLHQHVEKETPGEYEQLCQPGLMGPVWGHQQHPGPHHWQKREGRERREGPGATCTQGHPPPTSLWDPPLNTTRNKVWFCERRRGPPEPPLEQAQMASTMSGWNHYSPGRGPSLDSRSAATSSFPGRYIALSDSLNYSKSLKHRLQLQQVCMNSSPGGSPQGPRPEVRCEPKGTGPGATTRPQQYRPEGLAIGMASAHCTKHISSLVPQDCSKAASDRDHWTWDCINVLHSQIGPAWT